MLSLRALARRAPRSASQLASYTTRSSIRPITQSFVKPTSILSSRYQPSKALFSTTPSRFDDAGQELAAKLEGEINIESENNESSTDSDSNVKTFFDQYDFWSAEDTSGEQDVLLKRSYDDEQITVSFSIADFNSPMAPEDEADEAFMDEDEDIESAQSGGANTKGAINQGRTSGGNVKVAPEDSIAPAVREELRNDEDEDYSPQQAFPADVTVLVQRSGKEGALRFHLVTDGSGFTIHNVTHLPKASGSAAELLRDTADTVYTGPQFEQLDEEVQILMQNYLEKRGFDTALATFIPDYIDVKEQREYLSWLGRMKNFVE